MKIRLPYGKVSEIGIFTFDEIERSAPEEPGIYGWYIIPWNNDDVDSMARELSAVSSQRELTVEATAKPRLRYKGVIVQATPEFRPLSGVPQDFFLATTLAFAEPFYVGKATKSLRDRLGQHIALIRKHAARWRAGQSEIEKNLREEDRDFAERARRIVREVPDMRNVHFVAKTIAAGAAESQERIDAESAIHAVEQFWISVLNPKLSRR